jgi:hypothetical protein
MKIFVTKIWKQALYLKTMCSGFYCKSDMAKYCNVLMVNILFFYFILVTGLIFILYFGYRIDFLRYFSYWISFCTLFWLPDWFFFTLFWLLDWFRNYECRWFKPDSNLYTSSCWEQILEEYQLLRQVSFAALRFRVAPSSGPYNWICKVSHTKDILREQKLAWAVFSRQAFVCNEREASDF